VGDITYQYSFIANDPDNTERNIILEKEWDDFNIFTWFQWVIWWC
jgi:hypothetical protein